MMTKEQVQQGILANTLRLFNLAGTICRMPPSVIRDSLIKQHDAAVSTLAALNTIRNIVCKDACQYGFTDKCPGCICDICPAYARGMYGAS